MKVKQEANESVCILHCLRQAAMEYSGLNETEALITCFEKWRHFTLFAIFVDMQMKNLSLKKIFF